MISSNIAEFYNRIFFANHTARIQGSMLNIQQKQTTSPLIIASISTTKTSLRFICPTCLKLIVEIPEQ